MNKSVNNIAYFIYTVSKHSKPYSYISLGFKIIFDMVQTVECTREPRWNFDMIRLKVAKVQVFQLHTVQRSNCKKEEAHKNSHFLIETAKAE